MMIILMNDPVTSPALPKTHNETTPLAWSAENSAAAEGNCKSASALENKPVLFVVDRRYLCSLWSIESYTKLL